MKTMSTWTSCCIKNTIDISPQVSYTAFRKGKLEFRFTKFGYFNGAFYVLLLHNNINLENDLNGRYPAP